MNDSHDDCFISHDQFERWYKSFLADEQLALREAWNRGYELGRKDFYDLRAEEWEELHRMNPWWLESFQRPTYMEMEERRYGPLPEGWREPLYEEYPGEARRRARVRGEALWALSLPA